MQITHEQCRAARALLGIGQREFANSIGVSDSTIKDFEAGRRTPHATNLKAIQSALEAAGVEFIPENGGGAGVRLAKDD